MLVCGQFVVENVVLGKDIWLEKKVLKLNLSYNDITHLWAQAHRSTCFGRIFLDVVIFNQNFSLSGCNGKRR